MSDHPTFITASDVREAFGEVQRQILELNKDVDELNRRYEEKWERIAALLNAKVAYCVHRCNLPFFEEDAPDIPPGYGIERSADGGFYPYEVNHADVRQIAHVKDSQGLDLRCAIRDEAVAILAKEEK